MSSLVMGPVDYLVICAILLLSVGVGISGTLAPDSIFSPNMLGTVDKSKPTRPKYNQTTIKKDKNSAKPNVKIKNKLHEISEGLWATTGMLPDAVNSITLFGLCGEVYTHGTAVLFISIGIVIGTIIVFFSGILQLFMKNRIYSLPSYLRERFYGNTIARIAIVTALMRHLVAGCLALHITSLAISVITRLPSSILPPILSIIAAIYASVGEVGTGKDAVGGRQWAWVMYFTTLFSIITKTVKHGGTSKVLQITADAGKLTIPSLSIAPWERYSIWFLLIYGTFIGIELFGFSKTNLRKMTATHSMTAILSAGVMCIFILAAWMSLAGWSGLLAFSVYSEEGNNGRKVEPDAMITWLVEGELSEYAGLKGFYLGGLVATTLTGLSRRFNQLATVLWEEGAAPMISSPQSRKALIREVLTRDISYEFAKELLTANRRQRRWTVFYYKLCLSLVGAAIISLIVMSSQTLAMGVWEIWLSSAGILGGPWIAIMILALFVPKCTKRSVIIGGLCGWLATLCLFFTTFELKPELSPLSFINETSFDTLAAEDWPSKDDNNLYESYIAKFFFETSYCLYGIYSFTITMAVTSIIYFYSEHDERAPSNLLHPIFAIRTEQQTKDTSNV